MLFEQFCYDLLSEMKFINLNWRKGTGFSSSPADHGRDIECQHTHDDVDGQIYLETWFVECKHYQQGVPPDKIQGALAWATAERPDKLLIIASNFLSNPTKDHLESYTRNNIPTFRIKYWEKPDLERLSLDKPRLLRKYKLVNDTSSVKEYVVARFLQDFIDFETTLRLVILVLRIKAPQSQFASVVRMWQLFTTFAGGIDKQYDTIVKEAIDVRNKYVHGVDVPYTAEDFANLMDRLGTVSVFIRRYGLYNASLIDERKEIDEAIAQIRDDLKKESKAWLLLDKAHETPDNDLLKAESLVEEAVELLPEVKQEEYKQLGVRMAHAVVYNSARFDVPNGTTQFFGMYNNDNKEQLLSRASRYLEETVLHVASPDAEGLLYLACMYGYQQRFDAMITVISKAVNLDGTIREQFQEPLRLLALLHACGSDQTKIEQLGKETGVPPVTKEAFCDFIREFDFEGYSGYIKWIAVKKPHASGERGICIIKISPPYVQNKGLVYAFSQPLVNWTAEGIVSVNSLVPVEDLYNPLAQSFILFHPVSREYLYL